MHSRAVRAPDPLRARGPERALSPGGRLLIAVGTLYAAALGLSGLFVNIYIWKVDHSDLAVGLFNWTLYAALPLAFIAGGWLSGFVGHLWMLRLGVASVAAFFAVLLGMGERSAHHVLWLGALFGFGQGLFWHAYHVLVFDLTNTRNRGHFQGLAGFFGALAGMFAPFAAGFLIAGGARFSGYHLVFAASLALFAGLVWISFRMRHRDRAQPLHLREGFRLRADPDWRRLWLGTAAFGLREGLFSFYIALLVFFVTGSEAGLGEYGLYTGLIGLAAFYGAGKWLRTERAFKWAMAVASVFLGAVCLVFAAAVNRVTLLLYGSVTALLLPFLLVPMGTLAMNEIDETERSVRFRSAHIISREIALGCGRFASIGCFLLVAAFARSAGHFILLLCVLGFAHTAVAALLWKVHCRERGRETGGGESEALPGPRASRAARG